jgi:hypothetical protein
MLGLLISVVCSIAFIEFLIAAVWIDDAEYSASIVGVPLGVGVAAGFALSALGVLSLPAAVWVCIAISIIGPGLFFAAELWSWDRRHDRRESRKAARLRRRLPP